MGGSRNLMKTYCRFRHPSRATITGLDRCARPAGGLRLTSRRGLIETCDLRHDQTELAVGTSGSQHKQTRSGGQLSPQIQARLRLCPTVSIRSRSSCVFLFEINNATSRFVYPRDSFHSLYSPRCISNAIDVVQPDGAAGKDVLRLSRKQWCHFP